MDGFVERDENEESAYLAEEIGNGVTREQLIESMEELLVFTKKAVYTWEDDFGALIFASAHSSSRPSLLAPRDRLAGDCRCRRRSGLTGRAVPGPCSRT
jgi:hypothetical protein